jgi:hypothetical protein
VDAVVQSKFNGTGFKGKEKKKEKSYQSCALLKREGSGLTKRRGLIDGGSSP